MLGSFLHTFDEYEKTVKCGEHLVRGVDESSYMGVWSFLLVGVFHSEISSGA